jgi:branched-chain amino acid transport system substrate-binding protein
MEPAHRLRREEAMTVARAAFAVAVMLALAPMPAGAQTKIKIGVINDQSSVYADSQGIGSVVAAQLAVEDYAKALGVEVEIVSADHQNKVDIGANIARRWYEAEGVDMVSDVPNSAVAFAVNTLARDLNKVLIGSGAGSAQLTGKMCTPNTVHWTYDTWELGHGFAKAVFARGGKKWFFISADYAFGKELEANASDEVKALGGEVVGAVHAPIGTADFSTFLVQAQSSGADTIAFANAGGDLSNALKQAAEYGLSGKFRLPGFVFQINNVQALGLPAAQGVLALMPFYWDQNDASRAFAKRFQERHPRKLMPNDMQAGVYSSTVHYLKAVAALKSAQDGKAVVAKMKELPTDDPLYGKGTIRIDGRKIHPVSLYETKSPAESKGDWDYFKLISTVPGEQAFRPLSEGGCPLVKG